MVSLLLTISENRRVSICFEGGARLAVLSYGMSISPCSDVCRALTFDFLQGRRLLRAGMTGRGRGKGPSILSAPLELPHHTMSLLPRDKATPAEAVFQPR